MSYELGVMSYAVLITNIIIHKYLYDDLNL